MFFVINDHMNLKIGSSSYEYSKIRITLKFIDLINFKIISELSIFTDEEPTY